MGCAPSSKKIDVLASGSSAPVFDPKDTKKPADPTAAAAAVSAQNAL
jgi:hypothetical protein